MLLFEFFQDISWIVAGFVKWVMCPCRLLAYMQAESEEFWTLIFNEVINFVGIH